MLNICSSVSSISIHAPTRGATDFDLDYTDYEDISIHAPTRGATLFCPMTMYLLEVISIHAPTRGATQCTKSVVTPDGFQSTLPRGERRGNSNGKSYILLFQSTLPRGERRSCPGLLLPGNGFQSTLPRGERRFVFSTSNLFFYFNPRSHEGSDRQDQVHSIGHQDFNPRSHEGSDSNFRQKVLFSLSKNCLKYLILTTNYFK